MKPLEGVNLSCAYDDHIVLEELSLAAQPGQVLALIGPNGVGKTTLLRVLARLLRPREGTVLLAGQDLWHVSPRNVARALSFTPQSSPDWPLTVEQVVALGRAPHRGWLLPLSAEDLGAIEGALERTGLLRLRDRMVTEISGGEQKRVVLARALCQEPEVLLLDEPTTHLDLKYQVGILELVQRLAHQDRLTVILTIHDLNLAALYADQLALLLDGCLLAKGDPESVLTETNLTKAYGVPVMVSKHPLYGTPLVTPLLDREREGCGARLRSEMVPQGG